MTEKTAPSPRPTGYPSSVDGRADADDPRLRYELRYLELTARGLRACRQLGVRTVHEFLQRDRQEFTRLRNCGDRTYDDLARCVRDFLSAKRDTTSAPEAEDLSRPIRGLLDNPRADRAFQSLGITTIGEFLDTPKEDLLSVKGFGERTYWLVSQRIRQIVEADGLSLLPQSLLGFELSGLQLESRLTEALERRGVVQIGDLLRVPLARLREASAIGKRGIDEIGAALDRLIHIGVDRSLDVERQQPDFDFEGTMSEILTLLADDQRTLFIERIGLGGTTRTLPDIAGRMRIDLATARILEENTRVVLREHAPTFVTRVQGEAQREFRAFGGVILHDKLARGTLLQRAAVATKDPLVPLRLVRFLLAGEFFLYGEILSTLRPRTIRRMRKEVRRCCARRHLPVSVRDLSARMAEIVDPVPVGVLMHLVRNLGLRVRLDPVLGDMIHPLESSVAERLHAILVEAGQPTQLEDVLFRYRESHRNGEMNSLLDHLRKDDRFLEVGRSLWSLRSEHDPELALAKVDTDEVVAKLLAGSDRRNLLDSHAFAGSSERKIYMILACLRRDPRVRYLGRGLVCLSGQKSEVMEDIRESMRRAMGEIVTSRFLDNQPRNRRRLAECILHENRALVETAPDRIDLLTNYPFNEERLQRLFDLIETELTKGRGHATATELLKVVQATDLGGDWFTMHMLVDLLRRHTMFELLPGSFIARPEIGLGGWIQHRIRECLRQARQPMTRERIMSETPDLGGFLACIAEMAERDPMVQRVDDTHFAIL